MVGKETLFQDYMWSIAYYLTLQTDGSQEFMFPSFYDHVIDPTDKKYDSHIAQAFTRCFKLILAISKQYCSEEAQIKIKKSIDEFNVTELQERGNLKAHGCKKLGIQTLGDLLTISIQDISMRGGWELNLSIPFLTIGLAHFQQVFGQGR